jgi:glycosyltransferase involved in cell wall biosynthesis
MLAPDIDWELRVAGRTLDYGYREELRDLAGEEGLGGRISFIGEAAQPEEFLQGLDIFVLPSRTEGFSNALIEAMACGLPVIATTVGANPEVIVEGESGLLVKPGVPQLLAERLEELARDPGLRFRLGRAGRRRVGEVFSREAMCRNYRDLYYEWA